MFSFGVAAKLKYYIVGIVLLDFACFVYLGREAGESAFLSKVPLWEWVILPGRLIMSRANYNVVFLSKLDY